GVAVQQILPQVTTLSSKLELIHIVGHRRGVGHKLVSKEVAGDLEKAWRAQVRATPAEQIIRESHPLWILLATKRRADQDEPPHEISDAAEVTWAILADALGYTITQAWDSRSIRRSPRLHWDALVELFDDEDRLRIRLEALKRAAPEE